MNWLKFIALFCIFTTCYSQVFYLTAPSTLRLDSDETLAIAVEDRNGALVNVYIQDHPGKIKNLSQSVFQVHPGSPKIFQVNLNPADFPPNFLTTNPNSEKLVSLTVHSEKFHKEVQIPISNKAGYVFIQTDKPIYTPKERVHIRIIPLNEDALPSKKPFKLQIRNPQDIIVKEVSYDRQSRKSQKVFVSDVYQFPTYPVLGEWSATVNYGYEFQQNATIKFDLQEYVLPTFTVDLKAPDVILETDEFITVTVKAKYVHGKKVKGIVTFRLGVKGEAPHAVFFSVVNPKELVDGSCTLRFETKELAHHKDIGWFPEIENSHLVVEATVTDEASGIKEVALDAKGRFSKSPFDISFKQSLPDFKPGLVTVLEAHVTFIDGRPAPEVPTILKAVANGQELKITQNVAVSDEEGKVSFELQPEIHHNSISFTLETNDPKYGKNQAVKHYIQHKFKSKNNAYIAIERSSIHKLKVNDMFFKTVHFEPADIQNSYYTVTSKGKIILQKPLSKGRLKVQRVEFLITQDMVPNFRVTVFANYKEELIVDSLNIDIEDSCHPNAEVSIEKEFSEKPGNNGKIIIRGTKDTLVGLLGVDEAVYALSKKDLLTKSKVFKSMEKHDLGCGPGGGIETDIVMANAGLLIASNIHTPSKTASSCVAIKRRKRETASEILQSYSGLGKECCSLGMSHDSRNRDCETRTNIVVRHLKGEYEECSKAFLDCCLKAKEKGFTEMKLSRTAHFNLARMGAREVDEINFIPIEDEEFHEKGTMIRSDFRELWFFEDRMIGPDNKDIFQASLPHSITTWVIQAVSVSSNYGICVAEPQKIVSTKNVFLQLNLPYAVVRNEQVEIQATLYNYDDQKLNAVVYMYGVKDLCSGANEGEKSERKRVVVDVGSAKTVSFPVIPLQTGQFKIKVVALSPVGSDVVLQELNVIPEGYPVELNFNIKLDPSNQQRRAKRHVVTKEYTDSVDPTVNLQVTSIPLPVPKNFVPGTESCFISAIGDQFGPTIETAINDPNRLLTKPRGCGEQNIMFLAPTLYTMRYLKVGGKVTPEIEEKGYDFIRQGYGNQLSFRKQDGSYSAWQSKPTSTWLTAFVLKVFCQANELIYVDENVICSGIKWLTNQQEPDGSYVEYNPVYHIEMVGGIHGKVPMTAFVLIALEECKCDVDNLLIVKKRALSYLETNLGEVVEPAAVAVVAYALSLSDSALKEAANDKLLSLAKYDDDRNMMHWGQGDSAQDIETTSYALLNLLRSNDMTRANSVVNWLNSQQLRSGCFKSTQDTVVALQALSEYSIRAQLPAINLIANLTHNNDRLFKRNFQFQQDNAHIMQEIKVNKVGGTLFINTAGQGVGSLFVKLKYNVLNSAEKMCKFDVTINATEVKKELRGNRHAIFLDPKGKDVFNLFPPDLIRSVQGALEAEDPLLEVDPRNRQLRIPLIAKPQVIRDRIRIKRENQGGNSKSIKKVLVCTRYLGNKAVEMSIVDVGIFSGYVPDEMELKELQDDPGHLIERYEKSSKGIVFYLKTIPTKENYCFSFHITREFLVGKTQSSIVKVYDYYNPDEACTVFYGPGNNSPLLATICDDGVCQCAEGGCPLENPFEDLKMYKLDEKIEKLIEIACEKYNFVWKGRLAGKILKENGFLNISFEITEVIKEGIEKADLLVNDIRYFLARDICDTAILLPEQTYLIMGIDGQKYQDEDGLIWYRYMLDNRSAIHLWTHHNIAKDKTLQRALNRAVRELEKGCTQ